jgi:hypothetical protein
MKVSHLIFAALIAGVSAFGGTQTISGATTAVYASGEMATDAGIDGQSDCRFASFGFSNY